MATISHPITAYDMFAHIRYVVSTALNHRDPVINAVALDHLQSITTLYQPTSFHHGPSLFTLSLILTPTILHGWNYLMANPQDKATAWDHFIPAALVTGLSGVATFSYDCITAIRNQNHFFEIECIMDFLRNLKDQIDLDDIHHQLDVVVRQLRLNSATFQECKNLPFTTTLLAILANKLSHTCLAISVNLKGALQEKSDPLSTQLINQLESINRFSLPISPVDTLARSDDLFQLLSEALISFFNTPEIPPVDVFINLMTILTADRNKLWNLLPQDTKPNWSLPPSLLTIYKDSLNRISLYTPKASYYFKPILQFLEGQIESCTISAEVEIEKLPPFANLLKVLLSHSSHIPNLNQLSEKIAQAENSARKKNSDVN